MKVEILLNPKRREFNWGKEYFCREIIEFIRFAAEVNVRKDRIRVRSLNEEDKRGQCSFRDPNDDHCTK